ncbi:hypothetical protein MRX96_001047 [Rhipicephalus microplus]
MRARSSAAIKSTARTNRNTKRIVFDSPHGEHENRLAERNNLSEPHLAPQRHKRKSNLSPKQTRSEICGKQKPRSVVNAPSGDLLNYFDDRNTAFKMANTYIISKSVDLLVNR